MLPGLRGVSPGQGDDGHQARERGGPAAGRLRAFLRYILWIVDGFPYIIPYLTGFIVALNSQRNQRVGDMAAGTFVFDKNAARGRRGTAAASPQGRSAPTRRASRSAPPAGAPVRGAAAAAGAPAEQQQQQKADWYPDPHGQARLRYWDGQRWTEHTSA